VAFLSFPTGFVAVLAGWFTAEVGRQPWVVYGLLRTKDAVTPSLATGDVVFSLLAYIAVYAVIYSFGLHYIYRLLRDGPAAASEGPGDSTLARVPAVAMQAAPGGAE
jgi:cytochrome d ubiquinol oxidase subunit I